MEDAAHRCLDKKNRHSTESTEEGKAEKGDSKDKLSGFVRSQASREGRSEQMTATRSKTDHGESGADSAKDEHVSEEWMVDEMCVGD